MKLLTCVAVLLLAGAAAAERILWSDCGDDNDVVKIRDFSVTPYPPQVREGFQFTLSVKGSVRRRFTESKMQLSLRRRALGFWVPIPCILGYGSCTYDNGCELLYALLKEASIPEIPETCPGIDKQEVDMGNSITLPEIPGPLSFLVRGSYRARGEVIEDASNERVICLALEGRLVK